MTALDPEPTPFRRIAAIILAAGASTRLGQPKQLIQITGERLLARAVRMATLAGCSPVLVVLGASAEQITALCPLPFARIVINLAWPEGIASSIRAGIAALDSDCQAALLMTCDQPAVTPDHLRALMAGTAEEMVASFYAGRVAVPAVFPASRFADLLQLAGDTGASRLLSSARRVPLAGGEIDVDTPESLATLRALWP